MQQIHIIATGGTISAKQTEHGAKLGKTPIQNLASKLDIPSSCELVYHEIAAIDSSLMTFDLVYEITEHIHKIFSDTAALGIIITHGTDTLEESAYFFSLCYPENENRPVIVTGSQRSGDELGSDALSNVQHAVWTVCSKKIRNSGVTVLFNQALFMPKYVHKSHTHFLQAFTAQYYGMLGTVDRGNVHIAQVPREQEHFKIKPPFANIDIYKASLNCTGDILGYYEKLKYQAIIIEAFGRGNVTEELAKNIEKLINSGCYVIITSDCANGGVADCYDFSGGLGKLIRYGAIPAFDYSAKKARIKMAVLLASGITDKQEIYGYFQN